MREKVFIVLLIASIFLNACQPSTNSPEPIDSLPEADTSVVSATQVTPISDSPTTNQNDDTRFPTAAIPQILGLSFEYPLDGQEIGYDGAYLFKVNPVKGAEGYLWGFFQNGEMVWENQSDEGQLSGNEYGIWETDEAHGKFIPGLLEVSVRANLGGQWTEPTIITIQLVKADDEENITAESGVTNEAGLIQFKDSRSGVSRNVHVIADEDGKNLSNIEVTYISDGGDFIILVTDPSLQRLPVVYDPNSSASLMKGGTKLASIKHQLAEIIIILKIWSAIQTAEDFMSLYQHPPRLERWEWNYIDSCWTGEQLAQGFGVGSQFIPLPGFEKIVGKFFKNISQVMLDQLKIATFGRDYELQQRISGFNGILRVRIYYAPIPIVLPQGYCLNPLDKSEISSTMDWFTYATGFNEPLLVNKLVGNNGTQIGGAYGTEVVFVGRNNGQAVVDALTQSLRISQPSCLGFELSGASPEKATLYY